MRTLKAVRTLAVCAIVALAALTLGTGATSAQGSLSQADYTEIQMLYAKYAHAIDSGDAAGWAATFTPDGVFGNSKGTEQLKAFAQGFHSRFKGNARHWNNELVITPTSDGAKGTCYFYLLDVTTKAIVTTGIYTDALVKTPAGWRFKERVAKGDVPPPASSK
jgi:ketosteroid isomerase-like protein